MVASLSGNCFPAVGISLAIVPFPFAVSGNTITCEPLAFLFTANLYPFPAVP